jgi:hypothetical protein
VGECAARAFYDCPAIISHRPRSQNISKEAQLNPEKDSRIKRPRSQVSLEKSSQNYKPLDKWAKPNLTPDVTPHPSQCLGECIWRVCHVVKPEPARISCQTQAPRKAAKDRGEGGVIRGLIYLINGLIETSPIQNEGSQWCAAPFLFRQVWSTGYRWSRASFGVFI